MLKHRILSNRFTLRYRQVGSGPPLVLMHTLRTQLDYFQKIVPALQERLARLVVVSDVDELLLAAHTPLPLVRGVPEWLSPLTAVIPGQLAAMTLAEQRGIDVDRPHGLHKITLTR